MATASQPDLASLRVLVTRPVERSAELVAALTAAGAKVLTQPLLNIAPLTAPRHEAELQRSRQLFMNLDCYQHLIFISVNALLKPLHNSVSATQVMAERAMNRRLEGGCQVPIAGYAIADPGNPDQLWLRALVGEPSGGKILTAEARGPRSQAEALGVAVAEDLLAQGAGAILQAVYGNSKPA